MSGDNLRILGLIPARAGSKGVPGKNTRMLGGLPMIARTIAAAKKAGGLARLIVSTDSPAIAAVAAAHGAEAPFLRPKALSGDRAGTVDAVLHALKTLAAWGERYDGVLLLQPTSPFRSAASILKALRLFKAGKGASVVSVSPADDHPFWTSRIDGKGRLVSFVPAPPMRRQDLPPAYALDGSIYVATPKTLESERSFRGPRTIALVTPAEERLDIDTLDDWREAERRLAPKAPARCFIIAEAGVNHNGSLARAKRLVEAAKKAGADAVKFQSFRAESLVSADAPLADYQKAAVGGKTQMPMLKRLELDETAHRALLKHCRSAGIEFMSTPFDEKSADLLAALGVKRFKIPSGEITNKALVQHVARKGKPTILSTGMSTLAEAAEAVGWIRAVSKAPLTVLHCVTEYPTPPSQVNLRAMETLAGLGLPVGYSDHTLGIDVAVAAAARGAVVLEKHLTLDRSLPGPDHGASLEPDEFARMVAMIRTIESALGDGVKVPAPCERRNIMIARRSLTAARDLPAGRVLTAEDLASKRPATGISPGEVDAVVGRTLRKALKRDQALTWKSFRP